MKKIKTIMQLLRGLGDSRVLRVLAPSLGWVLFFTLTSCSSEQEQEPKPEVKETAIAFSGNLTEEEVTRAETALEDITHTFYVWGYKNDGYNEGTSQYTSYQLVIPGFTVNWVANTAGTTTSNSHDWEYVGQGTDQTIKYWDFTAKAYRFFGYALGTATTDPATEPATVTAVGDSPVDVPTATEVTLTADIDGSTEATRNAAPFFSELWFSTGNQELYSDKLFGKPVQLRFFKPFAKVRFMFMFSDGISFTRKDLSNISFHPTDNSNVPTKGKISAAYPLKGTAITQTWITSVKGGVKSLDIDWYEANPSYTPGDALPTTYDNSPEHWYYVLPALVQGSYTIEVSVSGRQIQTAVVPAEYMSWKPGYEYTYKFKITEAGEVTFDLVQVAINGWNELTPVDHSVHNW